MKKFKKLPFPYKLKNTIVGWWIDGYCGYLYVGYFDTKEQSLRKFWSKYNIEKDILYYD